MTLGPYFYMLVGIPGSGKSTWRNNNIFDLDTVVLSTDDMIEARAAYEGKTYDQVFTGVIDQVTVNFFANLEVAVSEGKNILVDRTNLSVKSRKKILNMIPDTYTKVAVVVSCTYEDLWQRLASRPGKNIPDHVIKNMINTYVAPTVEEGFSSIVRINTSQKWEEAA